MKLALIAAVLFLAAAAPDDKLTCKLGEVPYKGLDAPWKCLDVTPPVCAPGQEAKVRINGLGVARKWCRG
jgi:hypothetical protein